MKEELAKKNDEVMLKGLNAMTNEEFDLPADDPRWVENKQKDRDGKTIIVTPSGKELHIDRQGITDKELGSLMLSGSLTTEQKNAALSDYMFQQSMDKSSFLMELFQSKGRFTKEAHHFSTMMRFDFENFVGMFVHFLKARAAFIISDMRLEEDWSALKEKMIEHKGDVTLALKDMSMLGAYSRAEMTLISLAVGFEEEATLLSKGVDALKKSRERENGAGIYVSTSGKVYDLNDMSIAEIVKKEYDENKNKKVENDNKQQA